MSIRDISSTSSTSREYPKAEQEEPKISHRELWCELIQESEDKRNAVEEYRRSQKPITEAPPHPLLEYLNTTVFPVLNKSLLKMLRKVKEQENQTFTEGDAYLNSLNFMAEYLWNMNPSHPERRESWTEISNITWRR